MAADDSRVLFADELKIRSGDAFAFREPWKILVADDEKEVHEITRITLNSYQFDGRRIKLFSAFSGEDVKEILAGEEDVALILLDVVMEREDTGLTLVQYIREELGNFMIRIVLRTGQPGKAPEHEVITRYDINDYKEKTELTAQKLFTTVTASLRAYSSLKTIERNRRWLERIVLSSTAIFESRSLSGFGVCVLDELRKILMMESNCVCSHTSLCAATRGNDDLLILAATGKFKDKVGLLVQQVFSPELMERFESLHHPPCGKAIQNAP